MNENDLGKALLNLDVAQLPPAPDPRELARNIVRRDRWRVRLLTYLAVFFWVLLAAGIVCVCPFYLMMVAPRLRSYHAGRAQLANDWGAWATVGEWATYWVMGCLLLLLFAALCTVLLILQSRKATLRQINASLLDISEQLKGLRRPSPGEIPGSSAAP